MSLEGAKFICLDEAGNHGEIVVAKGRKFTIGYYVSCDLVLADERAKGVHCEIVCDAFGRVTIRNLSPDKPILINGSSVEIKRILLHNSKLTILDKDYLWQFPKSSSNEFEDLTSNDVSTPQKQIGIPEQPPNSCPDFKLHRELPKRLTVHNFAYCIQSDEEGNTSADSNDESLAEDKKGENQNEINEPKEETQIDLKSESKTNDIKKRSLTPEPTVKNDDTTARTLMETPKMNLINCTNDKQNKSTQKKNKQLLTLCQPSDVVITSFSPRETGVKVEKSFYAIIKPKVLVTKPPPTTPKSVYSTPKSVMDMDDDDDGVERELMNFHTPSTSKKTSGTASKVHKSSSMHLIDLTTPHKLRPGSPLLKSALKGSTKKNLNETTDTSLAKLPLGEQLGLSTLPITPVVNNSSLETPSSVISVSSTDTPSVVEVTSDGSNLGITPSSSSGLITPIKSQARAGACTPKRTPQSLIKRALLTSAKKQATTPQRATGAGTTTTPRREAINRIPLRSNLALLGSPATPKGDTNETQLPRRQSMSTPTRKSISARNRFDNSPTTSNYNASSPSSSSSLASRRSSINPITAATALPTSTPLPHASNNSSFRNRAACKTSPLRRVRKSVGGIPLSSHISKARKSIVLPPASTSKLTSVKEKSPQQIVSGRLVTRARKSFCTTPLSARNMTTTAKTPSSILKDTQIERKPIEQRKAVLFADKQPREDDEMNDLSRTFIIDSDEEEMEEKKHIEGKEKDRPKDATFSPEKEKNKDETNDKASTTFTPLKKTGDEEGEKTIEIPVDVEEITSTKEDKDEKEIKDSNLDLAEESKIESKEENKTAEDSNNEIKESINQKYKQNNDYNNKELPTDDSLITEESFGEIINNQDVEEIVDLPKDSQESSENVITKDEHEVIKEIANTLNVVETVEIAEDDIQTVAIAEYVKETVAIAEDFKETVEIAEDIIETVEIAEETSQTESQKSFGDVNISQEETKEISSTQNEEQQTEIVDERTEDFNNKLDKSLEKSEVLETGFGEESTIEILENPQQNSTEKVQLNLAGNEIETITLVEEDNVDKSIETKVETESNLVQEIKITEPLANEEKIEEEAQVLDDSEIIANELSNKLEAEHTELYNEEDNVSESIERKSETASNNGLVQEEKITETLASEEKTVEEAQVLDDSEIIVNEEFNKPEEENTEDESTERKIETESSNGLVQERKSTEPLASEEKAVDEDQVLDDSEINVNKDSTELEEENTEVYKPIYEDITLEGSLIEKETKELEEQNPTKQPLYEDITLEGSLIEESDNAESNLEEAQTEDKISRETPTVCGTIEQLNVEESKEILEEPTTEAVGEKENFLEEPKTEENPIADTKTNINSETSNIDQKIVVQIETTAEPLTEMDKVKQQDSSVQEDTNNDTQIIDQFEVKKSIHSHQQTDEETNKENELQETDNLGQVDLPKTNIETDENTNKLLEEIEDVLNKSDEIKQKHLEELQGQESETPLTEEFESEDAETVVDTESQQDIAAETKAQTQEIVAASEVIPDIQDTATETKSQTQEIVASADIVPDTENQQDIAVETKLQAQKLVAATEVIPDIETQQIFDVETKSQAQEFVASAEVIPDTETQQDIAVETMLQAQEFDAAVEVIPAIESQQDIAAETKSQIQEIVDSAEVISDTESQPDFVAETKSQSQEILDTTEVIPDIETQQDIAAAADVIPDTETQQDIIADTKSQTQEILDATEVIPNTENQQEIVADTKLQAQKCVAATEVIPDTKAQQNVAAETKLQPQEIVASAAIIPDTETQQDIAPETKLQAKEFVAGTEVIPDTESQHVIAAETMSQTEKIVIATVVIPDTKAQQNVAVETKSQTQEIVASAEVIPETTFETNKNMKDIPLLSSISKKIENTTTLTPRRGTRRSSLSAEASSATVGAELSLTPRRSTRRKSTEISSTLQTVEATLTPRRSTRRASMSSESCNVCTPIKNATRRASLSAANETPLTPKRISSRKTSVSIDDKQPVLEAKTPRAKTPRKQLEQPIPEEKTEDMDAIIEEEEEEPIVEKPIEESKEIICEQILEVDAKETDSLESKNILKSTDQNVAEEIDITEETDNSESKLIENTDKVVAEDVLKADEKNVDEETDADLEIVNKEASRNVPVTDEVENLLIEDNSKSLEKLEQNEINKSLLEDNDSKDIVSQDTDEILPCEAIEQIEIISENLTKNKETIVLSDDKSADEFVNENVKSKVISTPKSKKSVKIVADSPKTPLMSGMRELLKTPKAELNTPKFSGVRDLVRTPKVKLEKDEEEVEKLAMIAQLVKTPKAELRKDFEENVKENDETTSTAKLEDISTPKANITETPGLKTPKAEFSGISDLLQTPNLKVENEEEETIEEVTEEIVTASTHIPTTPKAKKSVHIIADSPKTPIMTGMRELLKTPKADKTPRFAGIRNLVQTPKQALETEQEDQEKLAGIADLVKTPQSKNSQGFENELLEERPTTSAKDANLRGVKELLKTPKSCSTPRFKGMRELMQTPKMCSTPIMAGIKELMNSPAEKDNENMEKFLKTPTAKNIMIPSLPSSAIIEKSTDSIEVSTEYDLNATNEGGLEELFKTPVASRFVERITASYYGEDVEDQNETEATIFNQTGKESLQDKLNKSAEEAFDELTGQESQIQTPIRKIYHRKPSLALQTPQAQSPFSTADVLSDLPKTDVEEWIETLDQADVPIAVEDNDDANVVLIEEESINKQEILDDEVSNLEDSFVETDEHNIKDESIIPETCAKVYLNEKCLANVTSTSEVMLNLSSITKTNSKDPLASTTTKLLAKATRPITPIDAEISGIDLLDQTVESLQEEPSMLEEPLIMEEPSLFEEHLVVSDNDESEADVTVNNTEEIKADATLEACGDEYDLSEPLLVSDDEDLNLSQDLKENADDNIIEDVKSNDDDLSQENENESSAKVPLESELMVDSQEQLVDIIDLEASEIEDDDTSKDSNEENKTKLKPKSDVIPCKDEEKVDLSKEAKEEEIFIVENSVIENSIIEEVENDESSIIEENPSKELTEEESSKLKVSTIEDEDSETNKSSVKENEMLTDSKNEESSMLHDSKAEIVLTLEEATLNKSKEKTIESSEIATNSEKRNDKEEQQLKESTLAFELDTEVITTTPEECYPAEVLENENIENEQDIPNANQTSEESENNLVEVLENEDIENEKDIINADQTSQESENSETKIQKENKFVDVSIKKQRVSDIFMDESLNEDVQEVEVPVETSETNKTELTDSTTSESNKECEDSSFNENSKLDDSFTDKATNDENDVENESAMVEVTTKEMSTQDSETDLSSSAAAIKENEATLNEDVATEDNSKSFSNEEVKEQLEDILPAHEISEDENLTVTKNDGKQLREEYHDDQSLEVKEISERISEAIEEPKENVTENIKEDDESVSRTTKETSDEIHTSETETIAQDIVELDEIVSNEVVEATEKITQSVSEFKEIVPVELKEEPSDISAMTVETEPEISKEPSGDISLENQNKLKEINDKNSTSHLEEPVASKETKDLDEETTKKINTEALQESSIVEVKNTLDKAEELKTQSTSKSKDLEISETTEEESSNKKLSVIDHDDSPKQESSKDMTPLDEVTNKDQQNFEKVEKLAKEKSFEENSDSTEIDNVPNSFAQTTDKNIEIVQTYDIEVKIIDTESKNPTETELQTESKREFDLQATTPTFEEAQEQTIKSNLPLPTASDIAEDSKHVNANVVTPTEEAVLGKTEENEEQPNVSNEKLMKEKVEDMEVKESANKEAFSSEINLEESTTSIVKAKKETARSNRRKRTASDSSQGSIHEEDKKSSIRKGGRRKVQRTPKEETLVEEIKEIEDLPTISSVTAENPPEHSLAESEELNEEKNKKMPAISNHKADTVTELSSELTVEEAKSNIIMDVMEATEAAVAKEEEYTSDVVEVIETEPVEKAKEPVVKRISRKPSVSECSQGSTQDYDSTNTRRDHKKIQKTHVEVTILEENQGTEEFSNATTPSEENKEETIVEHKQESHKIELSSVSPQKENLMPEISLQTTEADEKVTEIPEENKVEEIIEHAVKRGRRKPTISESSQGSIKNDDTSHTQKARRKVQKTCVEETLIEEELPTTSVANIEEKKVIVSIGDVGKENLTTVSLEKDEVKEEDEKIEHAAKRGRRKPNVSESSQGSDKNDDTSHSQRARRKVQETHVEEPIIEEEVPTTSAANIEEKEVIVSIGDIAKEKLTTVSLGKDEPILEAQEIPVVNVEVTEKDEEKEERIEHVAKRGRRKPTVSESSQGSVSIEDTTHSQRSRRKVQKAHVEESIIEEEVPTTSTNIEEKEDNVSLGDTPKEKLTTVSLGNDEPTLGAQEIPVVNVEVTEKDEDEEKEEGIEHVAKRGRRKPTLSESSKDSVSIMDTTHSQRGRRKVQKTHFEEPIKEEQPTVEEPIKEEEVPTTSTNIEEKEVNVSLGDTPKEKLNTVSLAKDEPILEAQEIPVVNVEVTESLIETTEKEELSSDLPQEQVKELTPVKQGRRKKTVSESSQGSVHDDDSTTRRGGRRKVLKTPVDKTLVEEEPKSETLSIDSVPKETDQRLEMSTEVESGHGSQEIEDFSTNRTHKEQKAVKDKDIIEQEDKKLENQVAEVKESDSVTIEAHEPESSLVDNTKLTVEKDENLPPIEKETSTEETQHIEAHTAEIAEQHEEEVISTKRSTKRAASKLTVSSESRTSRRNRKSPARQPSSTLNEIPKEEVVARESHKPEEIVISDDESSDMKQKNVQDDLAAKDLKSKLKSTKIRGKRTRTASDSSQGSVDDEEPTKRRARLPKQMPDIDEDIVGETDNKIVAQTTENPTSDSLAIDSEKLPSTTEEDHEGTIIHKPHDEHHEEQSTKSVSQVKEILDEPKNMTLSGGQITEINLEPEYQGFPPEVKDTDTITLTAKEPPSSLVDKTELTIEEETSTEETKHMEANDAGGAEQQEKEVISAKRSTKRGASKLTVVELPKSRSSSRNRKSPARQPSSSTINKIPKEEVESHTTEAAKVDEIVISDDESIDIKQNKVQDDLTEKDVKAKLKSTKPRGKRTRTASVSSQGSVADEEPTKRRARLPKQMPDKDEAIVEETENKTSNKESEEQSSAEASANEKKAEKLTEPQPQAIDSDKEPSSTEEKEQQHEEKSTRSVSQAKENVDEPKNKPLTEVQVTEVNLEPEDQRSSPEVKEKEVRGRRGRHHVVAEDEDHETKHATKRRAAVVAKHLTGDQQESGPVSKRRVGRRKQEHEEEEHAHSIHVTADDCKTPVDTSMEAIVHEEPKKTRGRKKKEEHVIETEHLKTEQEKPEVEVSHEESASTSSKRRVGRRKLRDEHERDHDNTPVTTEEEKTVESLAPEEPKRGRGRRMKDEQPEEPEQATTSHSPEAKPRGRKRKESHTDNEDHKDDQKQQAESNSHSPEAKPRGRKRKELHNDNDDQHQQQKDDQGQQAEPKLNLLSAVNAQTPQRATPAARRGRKASAIDVDRHAHIVAETAEDTPSKRPLRKAATVYHNYDETSNDAIMPTKTKKKTDSPRKSLEAAKTSPTATVTTANVTEPSITASSATTARGRTRKPTARVQQFLEEERAKAETPKKRALLAAADVTADTPTPQRMPGRRGRKPSTIDVEVDTVATPQASKRGRGKAHNEELPKQTAIVIEEKETEPTTPPPAVKGRRGGRKAKLTAEDHNDDEDEPPPPKKSPLVLEAEKEVTSPASEEVTPTRTAGRRGAATAAKARIEEDALAAAALDPPKRARAKKTVAAKIVAAAAAATDTESHSSEMDEEQQNEDNEKPVIKRGGRKVAASTIATDSPVAVPSKRGRQAKTVSEATETEIAAAGEVKATRGAGRGRKNVHFDEIQATKKAAAESLEQHSAAEHSSEEPTAAPSTRGTRSRRK